MIWRPLVIALTFLTRLPMPALTEVDEREVGRSLLWYPLVGLVIGALLMAAAWLFAGAAPLLCAALVLVVWVVVTGALHLDGLADSVDAWMGGLGSRERTLAIMKDPYCGPGAVVALVLVLLVKFAALDSILTADNWVWLLLAPLLGRVALPLLFLTTPYVRSGGLGSVLVQHLPRRAASIVVLAGSLMAVMLAGLTGVLTLAVAGALFVWLRALMLSRIHGTTGDTAGAVVELIETAVLVVVVAI